MAHVEMQVPCRQWQHCSHQMVEETAVAQVERQVPCMLPIPEDGFACMAGLLRLIENIYCEYLRTAE